MKKLQKMLNLTANEWKWVLYDIGNSAFILLATAIVPIYFHALTDDAGLSEAQYVTNWGYATSAATLIVFFLAPICGALADHNGFKKPMFSLCVLLGAVGCAALGAAWSWLSFLIVFIVAKVGFNASLVFYDAMLPEITTEERMDNVSSAGYALGYIGSVIPFIACLLVVLNADALGLSTTAAMVIAFSVTAAWWGVCTLPLLKSYRQTAYSAHTGNPLVSAFSRLGKTFSEVKQQKHIFLYMVSFFFFIDGVYTIIGMATTYGSSLGLDSTGLLLALLVTQIVAFPCSIVFGLHRLCDSLYCVLAGGAECGCTGAIHHGGHGDCFFRHSGVVGRVYPAAAEILPADGLFCPYRQPAGVRLLPAGENLFRGEAAEAHFLVYGFLLFLY